jgi:phosphoribosylformimino-5-aminoimidazole carboxamide ribotide isomerase
VIDLLNGSVVHAKKGDRVHYLPIKSCLTSSTKPIDIVKAFMDIYPFNTLYIADLNAIQSIENTSTSHRICVDEIHANYPELTIWIDAGINSLEKAMEWKAPHTQFILGSEAFVSLAEFQQLTSALNTPFHLSLDFISNEYIGPQALLDSSQLWPDKVISMTLTNVGANQGTNQEIILKLLKKAKQSVIYAAGGVRNKQDLYLLRTFGTAGALIASALHNKQITRVDLESFVQHIKKPE